MNISQYIEKATPLITENYLAARTFILRDALARLKPRTDWLQNYTFKLFRTDALAGLVVASVLVPNAIAYSILAGLEPIMGLYAAFVGAAIGALWGSSRFVLTGPVGVVSLLTLTALTPYAEPYTSEFFSLAIVLAVMVGAIQFFMGFFRMGFIMRLIPHSVLTGFTSAAAIIIAASQLPTLLGFKVQSHTHVFETFIELAQSLSMTHAITALLGFAAIAAVILVKKFIPQIPGSLTVLVGFGVASYFFGLAEHGVKLVGEIPSVLPSISFAAFSLESFTTIVGVAFLIAVVGFVETYAIARSTAKDTDERIDPNQELVGQGLANVGSGLFGGYSVSGSFSLTALNRHANAATRMANVYAAVIVLLVILVLSPLLFYLPKTVLAALVIVAVSSSVKLRPIWSAAYVSASDGIIAVSTFALAFIFKPDDAVFIGIIIAFGLFMRRVMWVDVDEVGVSTRDDMLRTLKATDSKYITTYPRVLMVRMSMSLMYANSERMVSETLKRVDEHEEKFDEPIKALVLDCTGMSFIDMTGIEAFETLLEDLHERGIDVAVVYPRAEAKDTMERGGLFREMSFLETMDDLRAYIERFIGDDSAKLPLKV